MRSSSRRSSRGGRTSNGGLSKDETAFSVLRTYVLQVDFKPVPDPDNVMKNIWIRNGTETKVGVDGVNRIKEHEFTVKKYEDFWRKEMAEMEDIIVQWAFKLPVEAKAHLDKNLFDDDDDVHVANAANAPPDIDKEKAKSPDTKYSGKKKRQTCKKQEEKSHYDGDGDRHDGIATISKETNATNPRQKKKPTRSQKKSMQKNDEIAPPRNDDDSNGKGDTEGDYESDLSEETSHATPLCEDGADGIINSRGKEIYLERKKEELAEHWQKKKGHRLSSLDHCKDNGQSFTTAITAAQAAKIIKLPARKRRRGHVPKNTRQHNDETTSSRKADNSDAEGNSGVDDEGKGRAKHPTDGATPPRLHEADAEGNENEDDKESRPVKKKRKTAKSNVSGKKNGQKRKGRKLLSDHHNHDGDNGRQDCATIISEGAGATAKMLPQRRRRTRSQKSSNYHYEKLPGYNDDANAKRNTEGDDEGNNLSKQPTDEATAPRSDEAGDEGNIEGDGRIIHPVTKKSKNAKSNVSGKKQKGSKLSSDHHDGDRQVRTTTISEGSNAATPSPSKRRGRSKSKDEQQNDKSKQLDPDTDGNFEVDDEGNRLPMQLTDEGTPPRSDKAHAVGKTQRDDEETHKLTRNRKNAKFDDSGEKNVQAEEGRKLSSERDDFDDDNAHDGIIDISEMASAAMPPQKRRRDNPRKKSKPKHNEKVPAGHDVDPMTMENSEGDDANGLPKRFLDEAKSQRQGSEFAKGNVNEDDNECPVASLTTIESHLPPQDQQQTGADTTPLTPSFKAANYRLKNDKEDEKTKRFACPNCAKVFSSVNGLRYHVENKVCERAPEPKEVKPLPCPYCSKLFTMPINLRMHLENKVCQQPKEKPHSCTHCGKTFSTIGRLRRHLNKKFCKALSPNKGGSRERTERKTGDSPPSPKTKKKVGKVRKRPSRAKTSSVEVEKGDSKDGKETPNGDLSKKKETNRKKRKRKSEGSVASPPSSSGEANPPSSSGEANVSGKTYQMIQLFQQLKPGRKFITRYGVVEVIADDRLPSDHHKEKIMKEKNADRCFTRRVERFIEREKLVVDQIAAGTRHRREELKNMYVESLRTCVSATPMTQKKVWSLYCKSVTPNQALTGRLTCGYNNDQSERRMKIELLDPRDNPRFPRNYYPDRIVECKLVNDGRQVFVVTARDFINIDDADNQLEFHARVKKDKLTFPMQIFIARRELIREYATSKTGYICGDCGRNFERNAIKLHLQTGRCSRNKESKKHTKEKRIKAIERKALVDLGHNLVQDFHGVKKPPSQSDPASFGNPHRIKEHKKHKMPPWLVFSAQRSPMYPEIYDCLKFRRGSQNRNYFDKIHDMMKEGGGYVCKAEKSRRRKKKLKKVRRKDPGENLQLTLPSLVADTTKELPNNSTKELSLKPNGKSKQSDLLPSPVRSSEPEGKSPEQAKSGEKKQLEKRAGSLENLSPLASALPFPPALLPSLPTSLPSALSPALQSPLSPALPTVLPSASPSLPSTSDHDTTDFHFGHNECDDHPLADTVVDPLPLNGTDSNNKNAKTPVAPLSSDDKVCHRKRVMVSKKKNCIVIDSQVLATECESGRYPTVTRFYGEHDKVCTLCKKSGDYPPMNCDFCKNSVHQACLDKRMLSKDPQVVIRENEPHDVPLCHECISLCMTRRIRAENRRIVKWQHELSKAGLEYAPEAASLKEEVNVKDSGGPDGDPTFKVCPTGGPGGLICCSHCTAAYSRFLSNTAKEMEAQSIAGVGQEVCEILELLEDGKRRLQQASDVSQSNEERRGLLEKNQVGSTSRLY